MNELIARYKQLLNEVLPATYQQPVRFNHCFNRIVLDWLFGDCWYRHLDKGKTAYSQLDEAQLKAAIARMEQWLHNKDMLILDNQHSLQHRRDLKKQQAGWRQQLLKII